MNFDQQLNVELGKTIARIYLPLYYVSDKPATLEITLGRQCWFWVEKSMSSAFEEERLLENTIASSYKTCLECFCDILFDNLFEIDERLYFPLHGDDEIWRIDWIKTLFTTIFDSIDEETDFVRQIQRLARKNYKNGITIRDFGLIGEMLFYSLGRVLRDDYTYEIHMAWIKIFSWVLRVMVPVAVMTELNKVNTMKDDRLPVYGDWERVSSKNVKSHTSSFKSFFRSMLSWKSNGIYAIEEEEEF